VKDSARKISAVVLAVLLNLIFIGGFFYAQYKDERASLWSGGRGDGSYEVAYVNLEPVKVFKTDTGASETVPVTDKKGVKIKGKTLKKKTTEKKSKKKQSKKTSVGSSGKGDSDTPAGGIGSGLDSDGVISHEAPHVLAAIRKKIMRNKTYPLIAKENNWTGSVKVSFKIDAGGGVEFVKVVQGSGHDALDQAAVRTVKKAAPLPFYPQVIALVLEYRLE